MRYKILGYIVWQGGKWYAARWRGQHERELVISGIGAGALLLGLAGAGAAVVVKRGGDD